MKRLSIDVAYDHTNLFFNADVSDERIRQWVEENINIPDFDLNEPHSCEVVLKGNYIHILGDEDFKSYVIETIKPEL